MSALGIKTWSKAVHVCGSASGQMQLRAQDLTQPFLLVVARCTAALFLSLQGCT